MRLICGVLHLDGTEAAEKPLCAMATQMSVPRLQPSLRLWRAGPVGLAVLDFSARGAAARGLHKSGSTTIAADVRLDDPAGLRRMLGAKSSVSEDSLLLAMLMRLGPSGLAQISGDFAFASWNSISQQLVCARDPFGIRPFAYVHQPGKIFAFASLPKALHGSAIVPKKIDEDAVARYMLRVLRMDECLIANIKRLAPAHFIEISEQGISVRRYWQLDRTAVGTKNYSPDEAARELCRLVDEAVSCRLPRAGQTGAHLSGGLDSSAISVLAARRLREEGRTLHAYSFLDRQRDDIALEDETEFVNAVLEQEADIDWTPIRAPAAVASSDEQMDADMMTPLGVQHPDNAVCARAEEQGVSLLLSGWGGDEGATFNGRGTFAELLRRGRWLTLAREISALARERGWSRSRIFYNEIIAYLVPETVIDIARQIAGKNHNLDSLLRQSLSAAAHHRLAAPEGLRMTPDARENRWRLITSPHIAQITEMWAEIGARHGLAFAFPLLDRRVVEFSLSLSSELFLRGGYRRRLFRDAMVNVLPALVRLRHQKYQPFPSAMLDLAERKHEILERIDAYAQIERVRRVLNLSHLRRLVEAFPPGESLRAEMGGGGDTTAAASLATAGSMLWVADYLILHGVDEAGGG